MPYCKYATSGRTRSSAAVEQKTDPLRCWTKIRNVSLMRTSTITAGVGPFNTSLVRNTLHGVKALRQHGRFDRVMVPLTIFIRPVWNTYCRIRRPRSENRDGIASDGFRTPWPGLSREVLGLWLQNACTTNGRKIQA